MPEEWVQCILVFAKIMYLLQFKCNSRKYHLISLTSLNGNLHSIQKKCFTPVGDQQYLGSPNLTEVTINSIHSSGLWIFSKSLNKPSSDASAFSSYTHQWSLPAATATPVHTIYPTVQVSLLCSVAHCAAGFQQGYCYCNYFRLLPASELQSLSYSTMWDALIFTEDCRKQKCSIQKALWLSL